MLDWTRLINACNGQGNCSYEYEGAVINECREDYIADYMEIIYECLICMYICDVFNFNDKKYIIMSFKWKSSISTCYAFDFSTTTIINISFQHASNK